MDAYMKLPKNLLKMNLSPKELSVMIHLIYVEDYRTYKNQIKDGWFVKSKRELGKECCIKADRLNPVLNSLVEKGLIQVKSNSTSISQFKVTLSNCTQNGDSNCTQNNSSDCTQNGVLHNNNINNTINKTILSSTSNIYNNNKNIEKNNINNKNIIKENMFENNEKEVISSTSTSSNNSDEKNNVYKTGADSLKYYNEIKTSSATAITQSLIFQVMENCKSLANTNRDNWDNQDKELYDNSINQYKNKYGYDYNVAQTAIDNMINRYIPSEL